MKKTLIAAAVASITGAFSNTSLDKIFSSPPISRSWRGGTPSRRSGRNIPNKNRQKRPIRSLVADYFYEKRREEWRAARKQGDKKRLKQLRSSMIGISR
jgi:hypothetical protein